MLKFGFKKIAKNTDSILIDDLGDAFRHAGQNPSHDVVKDMVEKARALKRANQTDADDERELTHEERTASTCSCFFFPR